MAAGGLIFAAPASGSGKTLVTAGLLRCLRGRGVPAAAAKAGPDFVDPTFHALASGAPCRNLDLWAMRAATLAATVAELEAAAEIVLCEGVMGLFDGTGADGETGSTAELARVIGWPIVLVVDVRRQGASVAALLRGFAGHRPATAPAAVIFNRIAGERHKAVLETAVTRWLPDLVVLGALPDDPALALAARHLGLVPAAESGAAAAAVIDRAADAIGAALDIDRLAALARPSRLCRAGAVPGIAPLGRHIAVARDDAFCFAYPALFDGWRRAGATIAFFSPLAGEAPAPQADAVYLPGGYPELWAGRLAAGESCFAALGRAAAAGKPVYGECGGYMVLGEALIDASGSAIGWRGSYRSSPALRRAACRSATATCPRRRWRAGGRRRCFRGHEFHYATVVREGAAAPLWSAADAAGADLGASGLRRGPVFGSFFI